MKKPKLLLCLEDFPFPARRNGFSIRYFPIIEHFSRKFDIDIFAIVPVTPSEDEIVSAKNFCEKVTIYQRVKCRVGLPRKIATRIVSLLPFAKPYDCVRYDQRYIEQAFIQDHSGVQYDLTVCTSISLSLIVRKFGSTKRLSIDVIDSPYLLKLRPAVTLLQKYDAFMIKLWERRSVAKADCAAYISPLDRELGGGKQCDQNKVLVIPNGVYLKDSSSEVVNFHGPTIGYLGHMAYPPNIQAAKTLHRIFAKISVVRPDVKLVIVGRDPAPEIVSLGATPNVIVTGTVENIWPYVNGIDLFVFPMDTGSGQQNKLLEAMAAAKPVISTQLGNSGVGAVHGESLIIADTEDVIAENILKLMDSAAERERIGRNGLMFVRETYSWASVFKQFENSLFAVGI